MIMATYIPLKGLKYDGHGINLEASEGFTTVCIPKECTVEDLNNYIESTYYEYSKTRLEEDKENLNVLKRFYIKFHKAGKGYFE